MTMIQKFDNFDEPINFVNRSNFVFVDVKTVDGCYCLFYSENPDEVKPAKRKPVNGVLNLTDGEIEQLKEMQSIPKENTVTRVEIYCDGIVIKHHTPMMSWRMDEVRRLSTILWLAERFDLTEVTE